MTAPLKVLYSSGIAWSFFQKKSKLFHNDYNDHNDHDDHNDHNDHEYHTSV